MSDTKPTPQDEYAYGADEVDGCVCPATAAGLDTLHPALSRLVGRYDEQLRDGYKGFGDGTVPDKIAETNWRAAVDESRRQGKIAEVELGELVINRLWEDV